MKTGNEHDMLHKRLEEAMNSIDDLTQILKNKVARSLNQRPSDHSVLKKSRT